MDFYINEEGYLCYNSPIYDNKTEENHQSLSSTIGFKQIKYKVGKDGLFEQVK